MSKVAVVTGGAQGIGAAAAKRFLQDGFAGVVVVDRNAERLKQETKSLAALGRVESLAADLRDDATPARVVARAVETFGRLDVLVNAAGNTERCGIADVSAEAYARVFDVNVKAPLFMMQKAYAAMRPQRGGTIINIASMLAYGGPPSIGVYAGSKAAVVALTKNAANAFKNDGIRVFGINLGWTNTEGEHALQTQFHGQPQNWAETIGAKTPFGRLILPEDVAEFCAYLCSEPAKMMSGAIIDFEQMPNGTYDFHPMVGPF